MIVPMKKVQIAILKEDYLPVIKSIQESEVLMTINKEGGDAIYDEVINESLQQRVEKTITKIRKYEPKKPLFNYYTEEYEKFKNVSNDSLSLLNHIESLFKRNEEIEQEIKELKQHINPLICWESFPYFANDIQKTKYTNLYLGYIPTRSWESFSKKMEEESFPYESYGKGSSGYSVLIACFVEDDEKLSSFLKTVDFSDFSFPPINCLMKEYIENLQNKLTKLENEKIENLDEIKNLALQTDELRVLSDQILTIEQINQLRFEITTDTKIISGWVRYDKLKELKKAIKKATMVYEIEISDPVQGDFVPTYTKNNHFTTQFETITDMFSKPSIDDVDPNPVMSIWYWFLFGMMMGDVGYGILMILGAYLFKKIAKPQGGMLSITNIILYSGVPTIFWGVIFGSYFGFNPQVDFGLKFVWYWFSPMDDPIKMLLVSCVVGALHLITGLVIKAKICIDEKNFGELFAKNISWILILVGIGVFFIQKIVGIIVLGLGLCFLVGLSGRKKKSIFGKAAFGILGLYDATSYLGDVLSYSRIMALAMSSASIAMVMNTLAQMVGGSFVGSIFAGMIFIVGHIFNVVLGLLSAYVHDARLQYIEFFGKFYNGGGLDFKPLSIKTKYIKEIKNIK